MEEKQEIRYVSFSTQILDYILIRKKIKNIYITIKDKKVIVKAHKRVPISYIEQMLKNKEKWILDKLNKKESKLEKEKIYSDEEFEKIVLKYIDKYTKALNVYVNKIRIKKIKYAWGSCTSKKNITINYELIKYDEDIIEYVIVHELCHLKYMNHSKKFWELAEKYIPNYKILRKRLKN